MGRWGVERVPIFQSTFYFRAQFDFETLFVTLLSTADLKIQKFVDGGISEVTMFKR